jgi:uncharacterized protein (DUF302 family)
MKVHRYDAPLSDVVEHLIAGVEENEMLLVAYVNVQENARERGLTKAAGNRILKVFHPDYVVRVWEADVAAGASVPVCIRVCEGSDGYTYARYREPSETFASYENDELSALGAELDPIFARIAEGGDRAAATSIRSRRTGSPDGSW